MKYIGIGAGLIILLLAYLIFWPVPIKPQVWEAPQSQGYVGDFIANTDLAGLETLPIGDTYGPEDADFWFNMEEGLQIFTSGHQGEIIKIDPVRRQYEIITNTGGVPLGVEFGPDGTLYIADAVKGLMALSPLGELRLLTDKVEGTPIVYADDLDISQDGVVYFSDASTRFSASAAGSSLSASLLELLEHGRSGRVLAYDIHRQTTTLIRDGLSFPNGVALGPESESILVNETGEYRVHRFWVSGPRKGEHLVILDNLPGFPDNINKGPIIDGIGQTYLLGLISPRSSWVDKTARKPLSRKIAMRLPAFMRVKPQNYSMVILMDSVGNVLKTWQDPSGSYPATTGAIIAPDGYMYVTSLQAESLGRLWVGNIEEEF